MSPVPSIRFQAKLHRPAGVEKDAVWTFLNLPQEASDQLPSRGMVSVEGMINGSPFQATLEPDGAGGHWLKVEKELGESAGVKAGEIVAFEIAPMAEEPEPKIPAEIQAALASAPPKAQQVWASITPVARRDWVQWITSAKKEETRAKRLENACDMLAKGKKRPCCFDRSGMYSKSLSCPLPEPD